MNKIRKEMKSWIILSVSFSFMFFVFAPLEMYLTNVQEFWFRIKDLLPVIIICFIFVSFLLSAIGFLLRRTKSFSYVMAVFFCIYIGFYIQGNFIPRNYGVLDGKDIKWEKYSDYGIIAIILWSAMLVLCVILCRWLLRYIYGVCSYVGIIISLILAVTSGTLFIQNVHYEKDKKFAVVSQKDMFSFSEENNCIILLYDTFDSSLMREILDSEDGDEYREILKDFTYYPDTVGGYPTTKASLPFILTGQWYENEKPYADYVKEAYTKTDFYDFLDQNQYDVGVYTENMYLSDHTDIYTNVEKGTYSLSNIPGFVQDLYKLVGFNYLPHQLKKYIEVDSGDFARYAKNPFKDKAYTIMDVPEFADLIKETGIPEEKKENNVFRFYHLFGTHPHFEFGEDLKKDDREYSAVDEAKGCIQSLKYYCNMLKEAGVYDNSVIIVMADHGFQSGECMKGSNPVFMIKERQAEREFQISDIQVSIEDFIPTVKTLISGDTHEGDIWSFDMNMERSRRFLDYTWDNSWGAESLPQMFEYVTDGRPYTLQPTSAVFRYAEAGNKEKEDNIYVTDGKSHIRVNDKSWNIFSVHGLSSLETFSDRRKFRWISEKVAMFRFYVKDTDKNYRISLNYLASLQENSTDNIKAKINGKELGEASVNVENNQLLIDISNEFISEDGMSLVLEFPNAVSPKQLGQSEDNRSLSIAVTDVEIEMYE